MATSGATVSTSWQAKIGTAGANGSATIQAYTSGSGAILFKLARFRPATDLPVTLSKGTCARVGTTLIRLPAIRTTSRGAAARTLSLSATRTTLIKNATRGTGRIAIRVGSRSTGGVKCGAFAVLVVAKPSPSPTPTTGGGMYLGPYFGLAIPAGWYPSSDGAPSPAKVVFAGPEGQKLLANSVAMSLTLDELVAQLVEGIKTADGVDPEQNEAITMAGVPGRLLAYHFAKNGITMYEIDAFSVNNGRGYELSFVNTAGTEANDMALFLEELSSFTFMSAGF
ncbi:MAG TPA: hypothetical protein VF494_09265 [Candidatus Limnocylindrales bacterium]